MGALFTKKLTLDNIMGFLTHHDLYQEYVLFQLLDTVQRTTHNLDRIFYFINKIKNKIKNKMGFLKKTFLNNWEKGKKQSHQIYNFVIFL